MFEKFVLESRKRVPRMFADFLNFAFESLEMSESSPKYWNLGVEEVGLLIFGTESLSGGCCVEIICPI